MQTLLITGAEGFVGQALCGYMREQGFEVVAGVRNRARKLAYERLGKKAPAGSRPYKALVCDVADPINVARVIDTVRPWGIVHLAGPTFVQTTIDEPLESYQSIVTAWANVLDGARRIVPEARVLMVSSCEVYGQSRGVEAVSETDSCEPTTTYGRLKSAAEGIARTYFRDYGVKAMVARPFYYAGPEQPEASFFGRMVAGMRDSGESKAPRLDGGAVVDLLHVKDVVSAYGLLLREGDPGEVYNVCRGHGRSWGELLSAAGLELHRFCADGPGEGQCWHSYVGDSGKLRELGWEPSCSDEEALRALLGVNEGAPVLSYSSH